MDVIRKLIREELESMFNQDGIVGTDIVNYLTDLPKTRIEVKWNNPRTFYNIPDLQNPNAHTEAYDKDFFTGWDTHYIRQGKALPYKGEGYVSEFENSFGEKPIFKINGRKIEILNPKFIQWKSGNVATGGSEAMGSLD